MTFGQLELIDHPREDFGADPEKAGRRIKHRVKAWRGWAEDDPSDPCGEEA